MQVVVALSAVEAVVAKVAEESVDADIAVELIRVLPAVEKVVAFAADHSLYFLHLVHDIHFAYGGRKIFAAVFLCDVAQGTCAAHVAYRIAFLILKHIIGHSHKRVLFAEKRAVLTNKTKPVNIRIDCNAKISAASFHD